MLLNISPKHSYILWSY